MYSTYINLFYFFINLLYIYSSYINVFQLCKSNLHVKSLQLYYMYKHTHTYVYIYIHISILRIYIYSVYIHLFHVCMYSLYIHVLCVYIHVNVLWSLYHVFQSFLPLEKFLDEHFSKTKSICSDQKPGSGGTELSQYQRGRRHELQFGKKLKKRVKTKPTSPKLTKRFKPK